MTDAKRRVLKFILERSEQTYLVDYRLCAYPSGPTLLKCRRTTLGELMQSQCVAIGPGGFCWVTDKGKDMLGRGAMIQKNVLIPKEAEGELNEYVKELKRKYGF